MQCTVACTNERGTSYEEGTLIGAFSSVPSRANKSIECEPSRVLPERLRGVVHVEVVDAHLGPDDAEGAECAAPHL